MDYTNKRVLVPGVYIETADGLKGPFAMEYEVWIEGYAATGDRANARFLGKFSGPDFKSACIEAMKALKWDMGYYDEERNSFWACRFYDNEREARASFG